MTGESNLHGDGPKGINVAVHRNGRILVIHHGPDQLRSQPPRGPSEERGVVRQLEAVGKIFDDLGHPEISNFRVSSPVYQDIALEQASGRVRF
jgi:hypothetical protein